MEKELDRLELIVQQNELLKEQNELLNNLINELASELLYAKNQPLPRASTSGNSEREVFIKDIDRDEMRSGFLVTSHRKKLWNAQIGLINEFARICQKYNLRWFAIGGTLLGAARHKGFIPWDDDIDVVMFRPDYSKFQKVAMKEIKPPYFLDVWCNYTLESELANSEYTFEESLQSVTLEEEKNKQKGWIMEWPKMKLRDSRTCMILRPKLSSTNQGIWLDIFPFDPVPPFDNQEQATIFDMAKELHMAAMFPAWIKDALDKNAEFIFTSESLRDFISEPFYVRGKYLDDFMADNFFPSQNVGIVVEQFLQKKIITYATADFNTVEYLNILTARYGDWRKMIYTPPHVLNYSTDISSKNYFKALSSELPIALNDKFTLPEE